MARKATPAKAAATAPALLSKPREEVRAQLLNRIEAGQSILDKRNSIDLEAARTAFKIWDEFNYEFLRRAFTGEEYAEQYRAYASFGMVILGGRNHIDHAGEFYANVTKRIERLRSIAERLDLIDEDEGVTTQIAPAVTSLPTPHAPNASNKVFIVHGQDEEAKAVVARFISLCDLEPIILHEKSNGGRTIIEKFESEADVGFAVVLLTPDDVGGPRKETTLTSDELKLRARQNVILELGYFAGRLGRHRVAALKKGDIEMPSDFAGVVWTLMDTGDAWKVSLARELKGAGYDIDLNKALSI